MGGTAAVVFGLTISSRVTRNKTAVAYIERYNRTVRYDWLSHYLFESIEEVQNYATDWMWTYNHERPNDGARRHYFPKQQVSTFN